mmetsp:Transcript_7937/g.24384  ORF Transcript_7937/g.24384 Transcript_7937/m.24384 type:complete len:260 (-) Transcript_7937:2548-3327(-)
MTSLMQSTHSCMSILSMAAMTSSSSSELRTLKAFLTRESATGSQVASLSSLNVFSPVAVLSVSRWRREAPTRRKSLTCQVCLTRRERVRLRRRPSFLVWTCSTMARYSTSLASISLNFLEVSAEVSEDLALVSASSDWVSWSELKWSVRDFSQRACILSFSSRRTARCAAIWFSSDWEDSSEVLRVAALVSVCRSRVVDSASFFCRSNIWASFSDWSEARRLISTSSRFSSSTSRTALRWSSVEVELEVDWCSSSCDFK